MRRTILVAILVVLLSVFGTVYYAKYKARAKREAHWEKMAERGRAYAAANGLPSLSGDISTPVKLTAPAAIQVPGPTATVKKISWTARWKC